MQYEIFAFGGSCFFIDGFCSFFHCSENLNYNQKIVNTYNVNMCETGCHLIEQNILKFSKYYKKKYNIDTDNFLSHMRHSCNLCNLYELKKIKNLSLKIVNRKKSSISFVEVVKSALKALETIKTKKEYIKYCKYILEEKKLFKCNELQCFYK
jgi:collagenase-like PrtC family protease